MTYLRSFRVSSISLSKTNSRSSQLTPILTIFLLTALPSQAQNQAKPSDPAPPASVQVASNSASPTVTVPAGTHLALVLTHPVESRHFRKGDDIYAQVTFPVDAGNEVVIPAGTFVQGTVDKLQQKDGRGELHLQAMAITFPDGYVAPVTGPITLERNEGYAIKDPGSRRTVGAFILPAAGAGVGALIGHSVGTASSTTTSNFPPGCTGVPPFCSSISTPTYGTKGRDAIIGAGVGAAVGFVASMGLVFSSHHFFMDAGSPVEMTLEHPITLQQAEVAKAVQQSAEHPVAEQPVMPRPMPPPLPDTTNPFPPSTSPGTPPIIIPGTPGPDGVPGPPTIIPGTPPGAM